MPNAYFPNVSARNFTARFQASAGIIRSVPSLVVGIFKGMACVRVDHNLNLLAQLLHHLLKLLHIFQWYRGPGSEDS
jgi:hypothetical protein